MIRRRVKPKTVQGRGLGPKKGQPLTARIQGMALIKALRRKTK